MNRRDATAIQYLDRLTRRIGAERAVLASSDGLLIAGAGGPADALEELAVFAPSQLPAKVQRPARVRSCRVELGDDRVYLATLGAPIPADAAEDLARIFADPI